MLLRAEPPANGQYMVAAYVLVAVVWEFVLLEKKS